MSASRYDVLHYRQDGIVVTNRYFTTPAGRYRVDELTDPAQTEEPAHPGVALGLTIAGADLVAVIPLLMLHLTTVALAIGTPILLVAFGFTIYSARRPARRELLARHRGRHVMLFATTDEHRFGQVSRALMRAMEAAGGGDNDVR